MPCLSGSVVKNGSKARALGLPKPIAVPTAERMVRRLAAGGQPEAVAADFEGAIFRPAANASSSAPTVIREIEFAPDSPLEGAGFELSVPRESGAVRAPRSAQSFRTPYPLAARGPYELAGDQR